MKKIMVYSIAIICLIFLTIGVRGIMSKKNIKEEEVKHSVIGKQQDKNEKQQIHLKIEKLELTQEEKLNQFIDEMSIEEKLGQLFIIEIRQDTEGNPNRNMNQGIQETMQKYKVGGVVLFKENIQEKKQTQKLIQDLQNIASIPLWVGIDEEGGEVSRVGSCSNIVEVPFQQAAEIGKKGDVKKAYEEARKMGKVLYELGFNMDFAPVADIFNNPENTVIGTRSFGKTAQEVSPMVISFAKGLQAENIVPVIKHFPGHGNTKEDSHEGFAYSHKTLEALEQEEIVPFKKAIEEGVEIMMSGHLLIESVDPNYPVTLSQKWGMYIEEHFNVEQTLLITDAMNMGAITNNYKDGEACLLSVLSGYDLVLMPSNVDQAYKYLLKAYKEGKLKEERINKSVKKILLKKLEHNILILE